MCGIFCCISQNNVENHQQKSSANDEWKLCNDLIHARGPDKFLEKVELLEKNWSAYFAAGVLWMQGSKLIAQPTTDSDGNILLWNGDIFSGVSVKENIGDTLTVLDILRSSENVIYAFKSFQGPYSFIYFHKKSGCLYFGRDVIGRHSLLLKRDNNANKFIITSVATKQIKGIIEVPAIGIFMVNLNNSRTNLSCYPWKEPILRFTDIIDALETNLNIDIDIRETIFTLKHPSRTLYTHPQSKDLEYLENIPHPNDTDKTLQYLLSNVDVSQRVERLSELLHRAIEVRLQRKPDYCKNCIQLILNNGIVTCNHPKIGILFSGGLDSAILSVIADKYVPLNESIDLINVAFERITNAAGQPHIKTDNINSNDKYNVPDRKTGRQTYFELLEICPNRKWNLIEVNISQDELRKYRSCRINDLLYPLCTILDESLGCALWFASRASGVLTQSDTFYESPCRVLLLGMGADELFGGYMRHRTILKHKGWDALAQELHVELERISERNLGRDDRIVSDHGRQSRLPYLDEDVINYSQQLKPWERCYPTDKMQTGLGDKLLLRLLARKLGFQNTASFPKRAFQFGSRIANGKENAKTISDRL